MWIPIFDSQPVGSIEAIAVAPSDAKIIYAGTGESDICSDLSSGNGVYKSVDGGSTWAYMGLVDTRSADHLPGNFTRDPRTLTNAPGLTPIARSYGIGEPPAK